MSTPSIPNGTPQPAPNAPTAITTPPKAKFNAKGDSKEEFCINVVQELIRMGLVVTQTSKPTKDGKGGNKLYLKFSLGDVPTRFGTLLELTPEQARRLNTSHGTPLAMDFNVALLDITPASAVPARIAERRLQTITRQTNSVSRMPANILLEELNRKRVAEGLEPIKG